MLFLSIFIFTTKAQQLPAGGIPFGGIITQYFPGCLAPAGVAITIEQPLPTGGFFPVPLMYLPGVSISFPYGPPTHPGQWLLGMGGVFAPCIIPCGSGVCPYPGQPAGLIILYHGSSV
ncbi:MAG: hypothetical protein ACKKL4_03045 [Patescibacteria group bacterium]